MTRDEAIGTLQAHVVFACEKAMLSSTAIRMIEDALDMAITALLTDGDCLSRPEVINEVAEWMLEYGGEDEKRERVALEHVANGIKKLPSVQPEIIRCRDCRFNTYSKKCLNPDSFFLVPADDFYGGYAERRTDVQTD